MSALPRKRSNFRAGIFSKRFSGCHLQAAIGASRWEETTRFWAATERVSSQNDPCRRWAHLECRCPLRQADPRAAVAGHIPLHWRPKFPAYRCRPNVSRLMAIQRPTQPSDRLNVPEPVFPDNCPTAVKVMPLPAPTECNVPSGSTCPLPPLMMILPPTILAGSEPV